MTSAWIELQGTANTRDLGGLPTASGVTARDVVIRSDNLQDLTPQDVRTLRGEHGVTQVIDLRTPGEAEIEGPTPLQADGTDYVLLSFVPDLRAQPGGDERILPDRVGQDRTAVYLNYLADQPAEVVEAVRRIAHASGATVIHCAAGKDRTGTLAALVLDAVGVSRDAIIEDFVATGEVIGAVMDRLAARPVYAAGVAGTTLESHVPQAETLISVLATLDSEWGGSAGGGSAGGGSAGGGAAGGGAAGWLLAHGLSESDLQLLRQRFLG